MKYLKLSILGILLTASACTKEDLSVEQPDPVFMLSFNIDSMPNLIEAGNNDFYLSPGFEIEPDGIVQYESSFTKEEDCENDCQEKLSIFIKDANFYDPVINQGPSLFEGPYLFNNPEFNFPNHNFIEVVNTSFADSPMTANWDFGGLEYEEIDNNHVTLRVPDDIESFNAELEIVTATGCNQVVEKSIQNLDPNESCMSNFIFFESDFSEELYFVIVETFGTPPFIYEWSNGDNMPYSIVEGMGTDFAVTVTDFLGCESIASSMIPESDLGECIADFAYYVYESFEEIDLRATIVVQYTDKTGKLYTSELANQTASSFFNISNISEYIPDEMGNQTLKMDVHFECRLVAQDGSHIKINNALGTIAVSYP